MTEQPAVPRGPIGWARHHAALRAATPPQDGPHAPQDGPQRPDAGAETPDGAGGRQTDAEPLARLRRLRDQLATEHAKAVAADQQPRPDLDHLRVTAHNGIAAGLETAIFFVDHHLREAGEAPDDEHVCKPGASLYYCPASGETESGYHGGFDVYCDRPDLHQPAPDGLREQYAAVIRRWWDDDSQGADEIADAVLAVRDRGMEQLAAGRATWKAKAEQIEQHRDQLAAAAIRDQAALAQIRLHIAAHRPRLQYADPILLGRIEAVLRQVGELEAAGGGEGA